MNWFRRGVLLLIGLCFSSAAAQTSTCGDLVGQALLSVQDACASTSRNQACYGNFSLEAFPRVDVLDFTFADRGDRVNVADIDSMTLEGLDVEAQEWGVVLMQLQANLPDALPGQNVTFLLFGDIEVVNADSPELTPMQAFYFRSGVTGLTCAQAPADGMLIQTPEGVGTINLNVNEVDIRLGSTAYVQAEAGGSMTIRVIEGQAVITVNGVTVVIPAGAQVAVPLDEDLGAAGAPGEVEPYDPETLANLPVSVLPRVVEVAPAATEDEIDAAQANAIEDEGTGLGPFNGKFIIGEPAEFCPAMANILASSGVTRAEYIALIRAAVMIASPEERAQIDAFIAVLEACP